MKNRKMLLLAPLLIITACATAPTTVSLRPQLILKDALVSPVAAIEVRAEKGDAKAQYALFVLYEFGLRGKSRDLNLATLWRKSAVGSHGTLPITQYIPGINGKPGRTATINVPTYGVSPTEAAAIDACAASLNETPLSQDAFVHCGGEAATTELKGLWDAAVHTE